MSTSEEWRMSEGNHNPLNLKSAGVKVASETPEEFKLENLMNGKAAFTKVCQPMNCFVEGVAPIGNEIFVVSAWTPLITAFDVETFQKTRTINVSDMEDPHDIAAHDRDKALFIVDFVSYRIYTVYTETRHSNSWKTVKQLRSLSFTNSETLLGISSGDTIIEYSTDGEIIKEIELNKSIPSAWHALQLNDGNFVVCHGWASTQHRVLKVDKNANVLKSFGSEKGSSADKLRVPSHMAVASDGCAIVADSWNNRIKILYSNLEYRADVILFGFTLNHPSRLHLDEVRRRLYICENTDKHVLVVSY